MTQLLTETNTPKVERWVLRDATATLRIPARNLRAFFEHGQWWVEDAMSGAQWSVHDYEGRNGELFGFEQVTEGDE